MTIIALFRGVNVNGKNRLPMAELPKIFEACGCTDVRTYIQSGNVVCKTTHRTIPKLQTCLTTRVGTAFGHAPVVVVRTALQWREAIEANPYARDGTGEAALHVMFLADEPARDRVEALDPDRSPGDRFAVHGREIYLHIGTSLATSKLTNAYFDAKLKTTATGRNWRTVRKLAEMARA